MSTYTTQRGLEAGSDVDEGPKDLLMVVINYVAEYGDFRPIRPSRDAVASRIVRPIAKEKGKRQEEIFDDPIRLVKK